MIAVFFKLLMKVKTYLVTNTSMKLLTIMVVFLNLMMNVKNPETKLSKDCKSSLRMQEATHKELFCYVLFQIYCLVIIELAEGARMWPVSLHW